MEVSEKSTRAAKFIHRKNWIATASDDQQIRIFDAETFSLINEFTAHSDFIRSLTVHPTLPYLISASDDRKIRVWDWENEWRMEQEFQEHAHYIMQIAVNPEDPEMFVSGSLDKTLKVWKLGEQESICTLEGHEKGVNCVEFLTGGRIVSGSDDCSICVWDIQTQKCIETLKNAHKNNVTFVTPFKTWIISGAEDSTVKIWNSQTFSLEKELNFEKGRAWCVAAGKSDAIAVGFDSGAVTVEI